MLVMKPRETSPTKYPWPSSANARNATALLCRGPARHPFFDAPIAPKSRHLDYVPEWEELLAMRSEKLAITDDDPLRQRPTTVA
jgi:hypothetical protein